MSQRVTPMQLTDHADQIVAAAHKTTIAGGGFAAASGAAEKSGFLLFLGEYSSEIASLGVLAGMFFGFCGIAVQITFNYLRNLRERAEHERKMRGD